MAELFDSAAELEQTHIQEGRRDGVRDGMKAGLEEGRGLGLQKGFEIGEGSFSRTNAATLSRDDMYSNMSIYESAGIEVGHYAGCVRMWRQLMQQDPDSIPGKAQRNITVMEECIQQLPLCDPQDERLHDLLEQLRSKYKTVVAALGKTQQYNSAAAAAGDDAAGQPAQQALSF